MRNIPDNLAYGKRSIRMVMLNGVPKFSATDICNILGYVNPNKTLGRFCNSAPEYIRLHTVGGPQNVRMIEMDDIRDILCRSRRKNVSRFRNWFENIVIPVLSLKHNSLVDLSVLFSLEVR